MYSLKKSQDFKRLQKEGVKWVSPSFILQTAPSSLTSIRVGYIVTRKMGSAVLRNRARRRLKEAIRLSFPSHAVQGQDYVIIARAPALTHPFLEIQKELVWSLRHLQRLSSEKYVSSKGKQE